MYNLLSRNGIPLYYYSMGKMEVIVPLCYIVLANVAYILGLFGDLGCSIIGSAPANYCSANGSDFI